MPPRRSNHGRRRAKRSNKNKRGLMPPPITSDTHPGSSLTSVGLNSTPLFPPVTSKALRYSMTYTSLAATSGIPTGYVFRANDLFDPDFTGSGHQPMGFDQMMNSYNHFCVIRAKLTVTFRNLSAGPCSVGIRQDANSPILTVYDQFLEFGGMVQETLEGKGVYGANKTLSLSIHIPRLFGLTNKSILSDPNLRGEILTTPTEVTYFHVMVWDALGNTSTIGFDALLEQRAVFLEPRTSAESLLIQNFRFQQALAGRSRIHTSEIPLPLLVPPYPGGRFGVVDGVRRAPRGASFRDWFSLGNVKNVHRSTSWDGHDFGCDCGEDCK